MKSLFAMAVLFAGFCACGGSEVLNRVPEFLSNLSVPQNLNREQFSETDNAETESTLRKIHSIPIAFVRYCLAEIKTAKPEFEDIKLSQSNLDKLETVKQKLADICAPDKSKDP